MNSRELIYWSRSWLSNRIGGAPFETGALGIQAGSTVDRVLGLGVTAALFVPGAIAIHDLPVGINESGASHLSGVPPLERCPDNLRRVGTQYSVVRTASLLAQRWIGDGCGLRAVHVNRIAV